MLHYSGEKAYFYQDSNFHPVYDFSVQEGNYIDITQRHYGADSSLYITSLEVRSADSVLVSGQYLKRQTVWDTVTCIQEETYIEGIGSEFLLIGGHTPLPEHIGKLVCFTDPAVTYFASGSGTSQDCSIDSLLQITKDQNYKSVYKPNETEWFFAQENSTGKFIDTIETGMSDGTWTDLFYRGRFFNEVKTYAGQLRTNSRNDMVWYKSPENKEYIVYDMTLKKGDYFPFIFGYMSIDSVYYENNLKVIELSPYHDAWGESYKLIEGVGPDYTVLFNWRDPGFTKPFTACHFKADTLSWSTKNSSFHQCDLLLSKKEKEENKINVAVNNGQLRIFSNERVFPTRLITPTGREIWKGQINNGETLIPVPEHLKGILILQAPLGSKKLYMP